MLATDRIKRFPTDNVPDDRDLMDTCDAVLGPGRLFCRPIWYLLLGLSDQPAPQRRR